MRVSDQAEELLEQAWTHMEEEHRDRADLHLFPLVPDDPQLQELRSAGLVELAGDDLQLTEEGRKEAQEAIRRHRLAERLLADLFEVASPHIEERACDFEHVLHRGMEESVCTLLGHPTVCPHGHPIPPGNCCAEARTLGKRAIAPLSQMGPGEGGTVAYLRSEQPKRLQKLTAMGILPGLPIRLLQRFPSYVIQLDLTQFAVDAQVASDIYVRVGTAEGEEPPARPHKRRRWGLRRR